MPWLVATALLHSALATEKSGAFRTWTLLLAIAGFSMSLIGTFLVRSGVITSVHSFASDPTRGFFIMVLIFLAIGGALGLFAWRAPKLQGGTPLTQDGKPKVLYIGAEYCPYCAMERWALIGAMSRFGTFSGITETTSSSSDVHPDTPTFSFKDAKFTSDVLAFEAVETQDRNGKPLQTLDGENAALFQKFNPGGGIPWIDYAGTHATNGATVDANAIDGKTYDQIIAGIQDPTSDIGKTMTPAMNMITAQLCEATKGKPADVCTSEGVQSASVLLKR